MKIIHSNYFKYIDTEGGKRSFDTVLTMFRKGSIENGDLRGRIGKILTQLWSFHQSCAAKSIQEEPKLNLKTRLGASLLHDSLWAWREEFGGQRGAVRATVPSASTQDYLKSSARPSTVISNIDDTGPGSVDSEMLPQENFNPAVPTLEQTNFDFDVQDMDWLWDVGFPSFLPVDFNSYEPPHTGF